MANRSFKNAEYSYTQDVVSLFGSFNIGAAGAVSGLCGDGITSLALTAAGRYTVTLKDSFFRFLGASISLACGIDAAAKTAVTGTSAVQTATFAAKAATTAGDHIVITDTNGATWAVALDVTGSDAEPTGAVWASIAAARKVNCNISTATTGAQVAALVETAIDALTGFTALITTATTSAAIACTHVYRKPVAAMVTYKSDETAVGSTTVAETTVGIQTSVDLTANSVTFAAAHGFETGKAVALTIDSGTLPAGLSATTYYVIASSTTAVKFATSLANAEAGTAVDITDYGTAVKIMSLTPTYSGSQVFKSEVSTENIQSVVRGAAPAIEMAFYNASGALVQPSNGTKVFFELKLKNSSVLMQGEIY
jgi:hypothetical protein